VDFDAGGTA
jgi:hypothetical protein